MARVREALSDWLWLRGERVITPSGQTGVIVGHAGIDRAIVEYEVRRRGVPKEDNRVVLKEILLREAPGA